MKKLILILGFCLVVYPAFADWQSDLESNFEVVETFDQLDDWRGANSINGYDFIQSNMPVKTVGSSVSMWNFYSDWTSGDSSTDWIKNHGTANVWQGTGKSLIMDLTQNATTPVGPSRLGVYFGSSSEDTVDEYASTGLGNSGLKEIYYFYMVKLPNNMFPTDPGTDIWPNEDYKWWSYHKFAVMSAGFIDATTNVDADAVGGAGG